MIQCFPIDERGKSESIRSEEHTSELQSRSDLVCRLLLEKKKKTHDHAIRAEPTTPEPHSRSTLSSTPLCPPSLITHHPLRSEPPSNAATCTDASLAPVHYYTSDPLKLF